MSSANTPSDLTPMLRALEAFQVRRLQRDFADLIAEPQYHKLGAFFFGELYAARDFSERNASAHRLHEMLRVVPGVRVASIDRAVRLMDLTAALDHAVARRLVASNVGLPLDEPRYELAYHEADAYGERLEQLQLIVTTMHDLHGLARVPLMAWHMRQIRPLADNLGFGSLARFLVNGLESVRPVHDVERFTSTLYSREKQRLDRIYGR